MKKTFAAVLAAFCVAAFSSAGIAGPAGTVLFSQEGAQIVDAEGRARPAVRGATIEEGERLVTPGGGIAQVKLADGSLLGLRAGSDVKVDPRQSVSLLEGAVRVIGAELMDKARPSALTLHSGQATLQLKGADLESAVVKGGAAQAAGDPGSYSRLQNGTASIRSGAAVEALPLREVSFASSSGAKLVTLSAAPAVFELNTVQPKGMDATAPAPKGALSPALPALSLQAPMAFKPVMMVSPMLAVPSAQALMAPSLTSSLNNLTVTSPKTTTTKTTCKLQIVKGKQVCL